MIHSRRSSFVAVCATALAFIPSILGAKGHKNASPEDRIEVVAHLPLTSGPVTHFLETQHYRRNYLYAEANGGSAVTLIDVTDAGRPAIVSTSSSALATTNVISAAGTAALVSDGLAVTTQPAKGQTLRIMSFADPQHPTVKQQFANVTAVSRDESRDLIFLANPQGIWILYEKLAIDPEFEREWEHMALDNH